MFYAGFHREPSTSLNKGSLLFQFETRSGANPTDGSSHASRVLPEAALTAASSCVLTMGESSQVSTPVVPEASR